MLICRRNLCFFSFGSVWRSADLQLAAKNPQRSLFAEADSLGSNFKVISVFACWTRTGRHNWAIHSRWVFWKSCVSKLFLCFNLYPVCCKKGKGTGGGEGEGGGRSCSETNLGDGATSCCFSTYNSVFEWRRLWRGLAIGVLQNCSWCAWIDKSPSPSPRSSITTTQLPQKHVDGFFFFTKDSAKWASKQTTPRILTHSLTCKDVKQEQQKNSKLGLMALLLLQTVKDDGEAGQWLVTAHPEQNDEFHKYKLLSTVMAITISPYPLPPLRLPVPRLFPRERERERESTMAVWHIAGCLVKKDRDRVCKYTSCRELGGGPGGIFFA